MAPWWWFMREPKQVSFYICVYWFHPVVYHLGIPRGIYRVVYIGWFQRCFQFISFYHLPVEYRSVLGRHFRSVYVFSFLGHPLEVLGRYVWESLWCVSHTCSANSDCHHINPLTPNDPYRGPTAPLTSKRCILYIYSTNIGTEYFKHGIYSSFLSLQNAVCFIILTYLVPALFKFYIQNVLKLKKKIIPAPNG